MCSRLDWREGCPLRPLGIITWEQTSWGEFQKAACHRQLHFDRLCAGIVDFCSIKAKLIIELDGSQHLEQEECDLERTAYLESQGYKVIRFWNNNVMNDIEGAFRTLQLALRSR